MFSSILVSAIRRMLDSKQGTPGAVADLTPGDAASPGQTTVAANASSVLLGRPGLGDNLQNDVAQQAAERRKKLLQQGMPGNQAQYGGGTLQGASSTLFGGT